MSFPPGPAAWAHIGGKHAWHTLKIIRLKLSQDSRSRSVRKRTQAVPGCRRNVDELPSVATGIFRADQAGCKKETLQASPNASVARFGPRAIAEGRDKPGFHQSRWRRRPVHHQIFANGRSGVTPPASPREWALVGLGDRSRLPEFSLRSPRTRSSSLLPIRTGRIRLSRNARLAMRNAFIAPNGLPEEPIAGIYSRHWRAMRV